ncbi:MAG: type I restriction enzyme HsdR N-terminal domain-containing protein [Paludibacteraceae bacterium]|nr:type I restriction enzyme HsdR N-terminal domain-containing protein [Paludibacteraceae bacterium]
MSELNLPYYPLKTKVVGNRIYVFDDWRSKYVPLTPEEEVRQRFLHYLVDAFGYPHGRICTERMVVVNGMRKRADAVVYNAQSVPQIIIEFKSPDVHLNQGVFDQVAVYCRELDVDYFILSNGLKHYACRINRVNKCYEFMNSFPAIL